MINESKQAKDVIITGNDSVVIQKYLAGLKGGRTLDLSEYKDNTVLMPEEYWVASRFSIVRHYGRIRINRQEYIIVNKDGKDIFECSLEAERAGRDKAIEPGEPCDLIDERLKRAYRRLGRDRIIELINEGKTLPEINKTKK